MFSVQRIHWMMLFNKTKEQNANKLSKFKY